MPSGENIADFDGKVEMSIQQIRMKTSDFSNNLSYLAKSAIKVF